MIPWLVVAAAAGIAAWLFVRGERVRARSVFALAADLESVGEYEAACFHYAVARNAGAPRSACEVNVRRLWSEQGPFTFRALAEDLPSGYCAYESCGEGYHSVTVADIHCIIGISNAGPDRTHQ
jgi:hypothetical protein